MIADDAIRAEIAGKQRNGDTGAPDVQLMLVKRLLSEESDPSAIVKQLRSALGIEAEVEEAIRRYVGRRRGGPLSQELTEMMDLLESHWRREKASSRSLLQSQLAGRR